MLHLIVFTNKAFLVDRSLFSEENKKYITEVADKFIK